ncbi:MAG: TolB protein, partial [Actinomycetota bacterium]
MLKHLPSVSALATIAVLAAPGPAPAAPVDVVYGHTPEADAATAPGANGSIVFAKELDDGFQLFSVGADGSGERRLTHVAGDAVHPDWSPDGTRIVFEFDHKRGKPSLCSLALINGDGSGLTDLGAATSSTCDNQPSFTPDGKRIVYVRYDDATHVEQLWTAEAGGGDRQMIDLPWRVGVTDPNASPDGKWITFVRVKKEEQLQALFRIRPDGTGLRRLTPFRWEVAVKHDWSPDSKLIALTTNADFVRPHRSANLITIRPTGRVATRVTRFHGGKHNAFA